MDNRNLKIIDENNIDRNCKVVCGFSYLNSNYALYYIARDENNDNLFVSKEIGNMDGTSTLVNIEDSAEKERIDEIVREMVKLSYTSTSNQDILTNNTITINGNDIKIKNIIFNRVQNINITKTYVATVEGKTSKKAFDFFKVNDDKKEESVFANNDNSIFANFDTVIPAVSSDVEVQDELPSLEAALEEVPQVKEGEKITSVTDSQILEVPDSLISTPKEEKMEPVAEPAKVEEKNVEVVPEPKVVETVIPTVTPQSIVPEVKPEVVVPTPEPVIAEVINSVPVESTLEQPKMEEKVEVKPEPVKVEEVKTEPVPVTPVAVATPVTSVSASLGKEPLVFNASNEVNLKMALSEESNDKIVTANEENVDSLRDFGVSDKVNDNVPPVASASVESPAVVPETKPKTYTKSKGFANNKFFTVVAIVLFLAACVFLGYEAFQYFTMTK